MNYILLIKLLFAHVVGDFLLQKKDACVKKRQLRTFEGWGAQILHAFIQAVLAYVFVMDWDNWIIPIVIFGSHLLIDILKSWLGDDKNVWHFIWDQLAHMIVIGVLSYVFLDITQRLTINFSYVIALLAYTIITVPSSIFISKFYNQWNNNRDDDACDEGTSEVVNSKELSSLPRGGEYIGMLERVLILTFVFAGCPEGIGFLLAAKSIFRFGDLQKSNERKLTEYVLIGTFLSFTIAIIIGYSALKLISVVNTQ